jgi:RND superfamily putative drug exporter
VSAIARWCISHRFVVIAAWVIALIGLSSLAHAAKSDYNNSFSVPGTGSATAQQLLGRTVPAQSGDSDTIAWRVRAGTVRDPAVVARMSGVLNRISTFPEVAAMTSPYGPRGAGQISHDGRIAYATVGFTRPAGNLARRISPG